MNKVKVLIVDDSAFMRKVLSDIVNKDYRMEVVGTARNGKDALRKVKDLSPDVITMDIEMPVMDGLMALRCLMQEDPKPIVMLSSLTGKGAESTLQAISLGAVDFVLKPSGAISLDINQVETEIIQKIITASKANVAKKSPVKLMQRLPLKGSRGNGRSVVAIGTSTGGPRALQEVLTAIPKGFPAPILVVQHMPKGFTKSLAKRIGQLASIHVKEAEHGEQLQSGVAYIAPGDLHMGVEATYEHLKISLSQGEPMNGHRPSVNYLYQSLAKVKQYKTVSVIMTGMGTDGMEGLIELKTQCPETYCIAESEETCVVYGMPKAVIKANLANEIAPLDDINHRIVQAILGRGN
ncbi:protein-glutamate methylesterase/protein-glutamine glutaminase [Halobacillus amylolyticus]|uniref:Protein-glutamate methylesterase/protein-glutamine glutaminase n=1 Tax=Halobacillus amylolyticus TaxID=2932259 RepID=A0ABY4HH08_9BACI|nr:chemotaxis response regulator protein-glutamate methylesterase [Halobacillus amylolyticus]UOR12710.1 chemotaxis response regulator protein-glutamate methylesterase [Halobacillus amylolyticus]